MTKGQLLAEDRAAMRSLPDVPFEACRVQSVTANSESLVRFDTNDYSVPVQYAHHPVVVKGYADRVIVNYGNEVIAEHQRCWEKERQIFNPVHYLPLLTRKGGSLDHGLPLQDLKLPECFEVLRRRLENQIEHGIREYISVLRLLERYSLQEVTAAVEKGLRMRTHTRDAIVQFLIGIEPWEQTTFCLDGREHLRGVKIASCDIDAYRQLLLSGAVA